MAFGTAERSTNIILYLSEDEALLIRDVIQSPLSDDESLITRNIRNQIFCALGDALKRALEL